ncbi:hypothetical protein EYC59_04360 [Candidatus Saccharibacteria bacterium]|nr:MAG: hypothetical protein EYC59_04360 [Candidatus Saccharibacteria bacterium]
MPSKKEALVKNALIIAFGNASVQLISFLLLPFYTSHLTTQDFGVVDLITTYSLLLVPILTLEMGMAAFRFLIDAREDPKAKTRIITNVVQLAGVILLVLVGFFFVVIQFVHIPYGGLALASVATAVLPALLMQFARGLDRIKAFAASSIVAGLITVSLNIILIGPFNMGARGMLIAGIAANLVSSLYLFITLRIHRYIDFRTGDNAMRRELLKYSVPLIPNTISWWVINAADRTIIAIFLGVASNGIYAIAYKFPTIFTTIFSYFGLSWAESASVHINSKDRDTYFSEVMTASVKFFGSLTCVMIAFMPIVFPLLVDKAYSEAYQYIPILIAASFFSATAALYGAIYIAKKKTKDIAMTTIWAGVLNVVLSLVLIKFIGLYATAFAAAVAYLVLTVYRHHDSKKYVAITYEGNVLIQIALFFIFTTAVYYYNALPVTIAGAVAAAGVAVFLNRSIVGIAKTKIFSKLKGLPPDAVIAEEELNR